MLSQSMVSLRTRAELLASRLDGLGKFVAAVCEDRAPVGGGSLPGAELPTMVVELSHTDLSTDTLARRLRTEFRIFARIRDNKLVLDMRTIAPMDDSTIASAIGGLHA